MKADLDFGMEEIEIGEVKRTLDVCALADEIYDALQSCNGEAYKEVPAAALAINDVLVRHEFVPFVSKAAAVRFGNEIMALAVDIKKKACDVWPTSGEPALPNDFPEPTSAE